VISPNPIRSLPDRSPLRILHLEDAAADAELIAWTLRMAGIQCRITRVETEESYADALRILDIDLILSDSSVPGFSGMAALEMAKAAQVRVPFVFVSGSWGVEIRNEVLRLGAADYLSKEHRIQLVFIAQRIWQNKLDALGS
jgi:CheY-like chemotaxis protein